MGQWLELFRTLKNSGIDGPTDSDTSRHTAPCVNHRPHPHDRSPHLDALTHGPVCHGVSLTYSPTIPLKNDLPTPTLVNRNGSRFSAIPSSIDESGATAYDAALTVFCDFETRNVGGCDLTKVGVWRYATDPATEIICFGYRAGGVDHSWAPTSHSRDPLEELAANPDVAFVCFGGFEQVIWQKVMVERYAFAPISTKRWVDLRATCCSFALPRSLDKALTALGLAIKKDKEGQRLVRGLSRPNRKTSAYPELTPAIIERVVEYNRIDIVALEAMRKQAQRASRGPNRRCGSLIQRINARGIAIDAGFVQAAKRIADQVNWPRRSRSSPG